MNKERMKEYSKKYYEEHKEQRKRQMREYNKKHRVEEKEYKKSLIKKVNEYEKREVELLLTLYVCKKANIFKKNKYIEDAIDILTKGVEEY